MKTLVLIITLMVSVVATSAYSEEGKTVDIKEMYKIAQAMKNNKALINDPETLAAMSRIAEAYRKVQAVKTQ
ncbi:MAG: hypothetical protein WCH62_08010 [Candidatus Omnitrophota bacterium]